MEALSLLGGGLGGVPCTPSLIGDLLLKGWTISWNLFVYLIIFVVFQGYIGS